jgi:hypothetical protein
MMMADKTTIQPGAREADGRIPMIDVLRAAAAILPAFEHIKDTEYRSTIAGCWARAAIEAYLGNSNYGR